MNAMLVQQVSLPQMPDQKHHFWASIHSLSDGTILRKGGDTSSKISPQSCYPWIADVLAIMQRNRAAGDVEFLLYRRRL